MTMLRWTTAGLSMLAISALAAPSTVGFVLLMLTGGVLARVAAIDLAEHRIPNAITHPALAACLGAAVAVVLDGDTLPAVAGTLGALTFGAALLVPHAWNAQLMGRGDVKLALLLGFGIGWVQSDLHAVVPVISRTIVAACAIGLVMGLSARRRTNSSRGPLRSFAGTAIPFGPALSLAGWGAVAITLAQR